MGAAAGPSASRGARATVRGTSVQSKAMDAARPCLAAPPRSISRIRMFVGSGDHACPYQAQLVLRLGRNRAQLLGATSEELGDRRVVRDVAHRPAPDPPA